MRHTTFGRQTGLRVSALALGTSSFGSAATDGADTPRRVFDAYVAAGGTTFDTSSVYQDGRSETVLGELLGKDRDDFVVITKYSRSGSDNPRPATTGNSRKVMVRSLESSLRRLQTDHVDVFMPHFPDGVTPMAEILDALDDLVRSGKILHGALSNFPAWRTAGAVARSEARDRAPIAGIETEYSLAERSAERELLPMAQAHGLGVLLYSPLAGGLLTGKYRRGESGRLGAGGSATEGQLRAAVLDTVLAVADEIGSDAVGVSLAWLRRRSTLAQTSLIPIVGPRSVTHLDAYLGSLEIELDDEHYRRLDAVSAVDMGTPHEVAAGALRGGFDGDRTQFDAPMIPAV
ncbi:aldo/keto reductase [Williamsia maris]|uniref:Oxidoreductase n=1 Tax=Williamsia maris TaxID=72806 RepID=A0ABT1HJ90_9NOCA|nr:aldo/keto reductase [Williamsia maris]MCP2177989.1 putative oxidoreductase [Williamsia maris]